MSTVSSQHEPEVPCDSAIQPCLSTVFPTEGRDPFIHTGNFVPQWYWVTQCVGIVSFPPLRIYQPVTYQRGHVLVRIALSCASVSRLSIISNDKRRVEEFFYMHAICISSKSLVYSFYTIWKANDCGYDFNKTEWKSQIWELFWSEGTTLIPSVKWRSHSSLSVDSGWNNALLCGSSRDL